MRVIQALHWLRSALTDPGDQRRIQQQLSSILADKTHGPAITADLREGLPTLPTWMQDIVRELLVDRDKGGNDRADDDRGNDGNRVRRQRLKAGT
jgi:hypothetical protein